MKIPDMEREYIECGCTSSEHSVRVTLDTHPKYPAVYIDVQLCRSHGFWGRLWLAVRYLFGRQCRFGHWDEVMVSGEEVRKLHALLGRHLGQWDGLFHV
jgi:hypothetical protein